MMEKHTVRLVFAVITVVGLLYLSFNYIRFKGLTVEGGIALVGFPFPMLETEPFPAYAGDGRPSNDHIREITGGFRSATVRTGGIIGNLLCITSAVAVVFIASVRKWCFRSLNRLFNEIQKA